MCNKVVDVAQRDLIEWTLTEAAVRAGLADVARSLSNERLSLRSGSAVNRYFLDEAQAIPNARSS